MRNDTTLAAQVRESRGKNEARRLRVAGQIPAVLYGAKQESVALSLDPRAVNKILHSRSGHNTIFSVAVDGGERALAMIVDWQFEPVRDTLLHVDLKRIDPSKAVKVSVPVEAKGEARGVKQQGGLLELVTREVEIEVLPDEIPESFVVDVTELLIGQNRRASELPMTGSMRLVSPGDSVLMHVVALRASTAEETAEEAAPAAPEPEVAKRGKKEEEEKEKEKKK
jgi:large subunit ribosomal protein L25